MARRKEEPKKKRVRKKKPTTKAKKPRKSRKKSTKKEETIDTATVKPTGGTVYKKSDFLEVDEEFRKDKEKVKEFHKALEKGELKWAFFAMDIHYYRKIKDGQA